MALRQRVQGTSLKIQGMDLEWVQDYLYLGVRIDRTLSFRQEVQYLLDRTKARLSVMRVMSGRRIGARHRVLRSFYVHAVRPIVDYASLAQMCIRDSGNPHRDASRRPSYEQGAGEMPTGC
ncbi:hypothetical protein T4E_3058 [Trichinella pseudospiralis]|uniref:Reverse transcriptase domain-containing protein n=1 Tax=Trichinella pseudospiralis TaxID=6337 RepID=A0A0V0WRS7_TRIPS|nr:hypothetical protein T4E_3058 [Trichinella pseudospiralis]